LSPAPRYASPRLSRTHPRPSRETKPLKLFKKSSNGRARMCKACDARRAAERYYADIEWPASAPAGEISSRQSGAALGA
jgi:hypothetical protein